MQIPPKPPRTPQITLRPSNSGSSSLTSRWKGPYRVCHIPNEHQAVYEDGGLESTIHVNHAKPAKFTAPNLPEPVPPAETPRPPLGYLSTGLARRPPKPRAPPADHSAAPAPPAVPAEHNMPPPRHRASQSASRTCSFSLVVSQA